MKKHIKLFLAAMMMAVLIPFNAFAETIILADSETVTTEPEDIIDEIIAAIDILSDEGAEAVNSDQVLKVHEMYDELTDAEKTRVTNFDKLILIEEVKHITYTSQRKYTEKPESIGTEYTISHTEGSFTVTLSFMTDSDNDGVSEKPETITFIAPTGTAIRIQDDTTRMDTTLINLSADWEDKFVQFNVKSMEPGIWKIISSNTVYYKKMEYLGNDSQPESKDPGFESMAPETGAPEEQEEQEGTKGSPIVKLIIELLIITILIVGFFIGVKKIVKLRAKKKADSFDEEDEDDYDDYSSEEKSNREADRLREYLQKREKEYETEMEADAPTHESVSTRTPEKEEDPGFTEEEEFPSGRLTTASESQKMPEEVKKIDKPGRKFGTRF